MREDGRRMLLWRLCLPAVIYGLMIDLASVFLKPFGTLACSFAGGGVSIPVLWWLYQNGEMAKRNRKEGSRSGRLDGKDVAFCIGGGIIACLAVNTLIRVSPVGQLGTGDLETVRELYQPPVAFQLAAMGFVIPAAEELAFRGAGFGVLRERYSFVPAAFWSSVLFGVFHGNVSQGIYGFVMGMILAWAMEKKRTLTAPILVHMAANVTSVAVTVLSGHG